MPFEKSIVDWLLLGLVFQSIIVIREESKDIVIRSSKYILSECYKTFNTVKRYAKLSLIAELFIVLVVNSVHYGIWKCVLWNEDSFFFRAYLNYTFNNYTYISYEYIWLWSWLGNYSRNEKLLKYPSMFLIGLTTLYCNSWILYIDFAPRCPWPNIYPCMCNWRSNRNTLCLIG